MSHIDLGSAFHFFFSLFAEHEQELDNLKLSLQSEYGERVSELEHNQENALQLAMENYESKMRLEREGNDKQRDQDMEKFKEVMGQDNIEKHNTTIEILKEQHRRDLKLLQGELDSRRNDEIENLKRKQKVNLKNEIGCQFVHKYQLRQ